MSFDKAAVSEGDGPDVEEGVKDAEGLRMLCEQLGYPLSEDQAAEVKVLGLLPLEEVRAIVAKSKFLENTQRLAGRQHGGFLGRGPAFAEF